MERILPIVIAFVSAAVAAVAVRALAWRYGVIDKPDAARKWHGRAVPLWGGAAAFVGIAAGLGAAIALGLLPGGGEIKLKNLVGLLLAGLILVIGGMIDDKRNLRPRLQIIFPILAALVVVVAGVGIRYVTNPLGGLIQLDRLEFTVLWWEGIPYKLTVLADLFSLLWLLGMTYTTKFLDGLDGLVAGLVVIGSIIVAAVSHMREVSQPDTVLLALIIGAAYAGLLLLNSHPARLFLGEGGATLAGFLLGSLAIISGGKIATALLVLGLPVLDAAIVIARRLLQGRSPIAGDRSHLHFRLLELGWSQRQAVLFYYLVATGFGVATLVLRGWQKVAALALIAIIIGLFAWRISRRRAANP